MNFGKYFTDMKYWIKWLPTSELNSVYVQIFSNICMNNRIIHYFT
ncbi:hypothetical protein BA6E_125301 [Bacteroidales bacterium 6E]|nr:hypothetical protein BA6E_125301 [Bacteroidales bacterium 6E]